MPRQLDILGPQPIEGRWRDLPDEAQAALVAIYARAAARALANSKMRSTDEPLHEDRARSLEQEGLRLRSTVHDAPGPRAPGEY
jgi:hypothetical protein